MGGRSSVKRGVLAVAVVAAAAGAASAQMNWNCSPCPVQGPVFVPARPFSAGFGGINVVPPRIDLINQPASRGVPMVTLQPPVCQPRSCSPWWSRQVPCGPGWGTWGGERPMPVQGGWETSGVIGTSGVSFNGAYNGEKWRLRFHVGDGAVLASCHNPCTRTGCRTYPN